MRRTSARRHRVQQRQALHDVRPVVGAGLPDRLRDAQQPREVDDGVRPCQGAVQGGGIAEVAFDQPHARGHGRGDGRRRGRRAR